MCYHYTGNQTDSDDHSVWCNKVRGMCYRYTGNQTDGDDHSVWCDEVWRQAANSPTTQRYS